MVEIHKISQIVMSWIRKSWHVGEMKEIGQNAMIILTVDKCLSTYVDLIVPNCSWIDFGTGALHGLEFHTINSFVLEMNFYPAMETKIAV